MKDFSAILRDFDGEPIRDTLDGRPEDGPHRDLTLGLACRHALCAGFPDEQNVGGEEKFRRASLAFAISEGKPTIKAEDLALIKRLLGKLYGAVVVFRAYPLLDPAETPKD